MRACVLVLSLALGLLVVFPKPGHASFAEFRAACKKIALGIKQFNENRKLRRTQVKLIVKYGEATVSKIPNRADAAIYQDLLVRNLRQDSRKGYVTQHGPANIGDALLIDDDTWARLTGVSPDLTVEVEILTGKGTSRKRTLNAKEALEAKPQDASAFERMRAEALAAKAERDAAERALAEAERERMSRTSGGIWVNIGKSNDGPAPNKPGIRRNKTVQEETPSQPAPAPTRLLDELHLLQGVDSIESNRIYPVAGQSLKGVQFDSEVTKELQGSPFLREIFPKFVQKLRVAGRGKVSGVFERMVASPGVYALRIAGNSVGEYRLLGCLVDGIFRVIAVVDHKALNPTARRIAC